MTVELALRAKGFIFIPLITRAFGAMSYGIWAQVSVLQAMLSPLVVVGLDSAAIRFLPGQDKEAISRAFTAICSFIILVSFLFGFILISSSSGLAATFFGTAANGKFVILCAPAILFTALLSMNRSFFTIINQAKLLARIRIVEAFLPVIPLIVILAMGLPLIFLITAEIICVSLVVLLCFAMMFKKVTCQFPDFKILPSFLKFGAAIMPAGYAMWVLNLSDRLFIAKFCTLTDLGVYSAAYSMGYLCINFFFNPFWIMYPAQASELYNTGHLDRLSSLFAKSTKAILFFIIPAVFALTLLGKPIMRTLTTEEFARGGNLIFLITIGYAFLMFASYFSVNIGLANKPVFSTINILICAGINLVMNYFLIKSWGITGAALATCLSFGLQFIIEYQLAKRLSRIRLRLDRPGFLKTLISSTIMLLFLFGYQSYQLNNAIQLLLTIVIASLIYLVSQFILKIVNFEEAMGFLELLNLKKYGEMFPLRNVLLYLK